MFAQSRARKKQSKEAHRKVAGRLLRAGRAGAPRETWIREAVEELKYQEGVDRVGVWLEGPSPEEENSSIPVIFRGEVWEAGELRAPLEWAQLSAEKPLPVEMLSAGKCVEYDLEMGNIGAILGPMAGLQRMVWVPVTGQGILRGLILAGTRQKQTLLARSDAERVAAELGLLLDWQEQRRLAATRRADLELWRQSESWLAEQKVGSILVRLARNCTEQGENGAGAVFSLIGERKSGSSVKTLASVAEEERLVIRARSGDPAWEHGLENGPLEAFWRQAIQSRRVVGAEPGRLPLAKDISRIVCIPLGREEESCGVLLAGLPKGKASLEVLGRLEFRAMLAGQVLEQDKRKGMESRRESWQRALLESSEEPVVLVDRDGFVQGMSRGARELIQKARVKNHGGREMERLEELFRPREWERVNHWVKSNASREQHGEKVLECELENGVIVRLRKVPLSDGKYLAVRLAAVEHRKKSRQMGDLEEKLRQALEWLEEGMVVFDEKDVIRTKNARFLRILGLSEEEGQESKNLEDVIQRAAKNAPDAERFAASWRALGEIGDEGRQEELAMEKPVPRVIERCTHRIVGENGKNLGRVEVYREMTARRMFESRMVQTEKLAALGQRVGGIVHELGSPLTTILGNAQRMAARSEGGRPSTETQRILDEAERATTILRQLLDLSSETQPERRLVSINELVKRTVELQRMMFTRSSLQLEMEMQEGLPPVEGDFGQLQQMLLNLLQNAQQAIEQSGRGTTIGVRTARTSWGRVQLEVWDDGPGIPKAIQARIFDPFFTTKAAGMGTGLGLAIVQGFVGQHGGTVTLLSSPPRGTRFVVELPAHEEVGVEGELKNGKGRVEEPVGESAGAELKARAADGESPRILVVEDEPTVGGLIADVLRDEGMRVEVLRNGELALRRAEQETYDLLICDLKMPGMDGQILYRELRQRKNKLCEKVLFVTGDLISPRTQAFLRRYNLPRVAKPFRVEELSEAVRALLQRSPKAAVIRGVLTAERAMGNG